MSMYFYKQQDHLISHIIYPGNDCNKSCIIYAADGHKWTTNDHPNNLKLQMGEGPSIADGMEDTYNCTRLKKDGIIVEGVKYLFIEEQKDEVLALKAPDESYVMLFKTKHGNIMVHTVVNGNRSKCSKAVQSIDTFMESKEW